MTQKRLCESDLATLVVVGMKLATLAAALGWDETSDPAVATAAAAVVGMTLAPLAAAALPLG